MTFSLPFADETTIGEINGTLCHLTHDNANQIYEYYVRNRGVIHEPIQLPPHQPLILQEEVTSSTQSMATQYSNFHQDQPILLDLKHKKRNLSTVFQWIGRVSKLFLLSSPVDLLDNICNFFSNPVALNRKTNYSDKFLKASSIPKRVQAISWHFYKQEIAVAYEDCVYVYSLVSKEWDSGRVLRDTEQVNISAMEWGPCAGGLLAVATGSGVCLWFTHRPYGDSNVLASKKPRMRKLNVSCRGVDYLAWHPDGRLLATSSKNYSTVYIWDVATSSKTPLRSLAGQNGSFLRWSPNGAYLFSSSTSHTSIIWETLSWRYEKWSNGKGKCLAGCWSPNSRCFLMALKGNNYLFPLLFNQNCPSIEATVSCSTIDLTRKQVFTNDGSYSELLGGEVRLICWDPLGERVAVVFEEEGSFSNESEKTGSIVAMFSVTMDPFIKFTPRGYIRGPPNSGQAMHLTFCPNFPSGALLTVCWSNNQISFYPLYINSSTK